MGAPAYRVAQPPRPACGGGASTIPCRRWSTSESPGRSGRSRSRPGSSWRRWRASACRRSVARDDASGRASSARRWSRCAGIEHRNERTLGYPSRGLGRASASDPDLRLRPGVDGRGRPRLVEAAGADLVDINFGCPVRKVTKTGAGATLLDDPERARRIVAAVAGAVDIPVTVKMRRGLGTVARRASQVGPRLVDAGAASLTLHPRSARQMYTGAADHALTAELVALRRRPRRSPRATSLRTRRARSVLGRPARARVMVGRAAKGNPWVLEGDRRRRGQGADTRGDRRGARPLHPRDGARARRAPRERVPEEVLRLVPRSWAVPARVQAAARRARLDRRSRGRLFAAAPSAFELVERLEAEIPPGDAVTLELPISIYGGG